MTQEHTGGDWYYFGWDDARTVAVVLHPTGTLCEVHTSHGGVYGGAWTQRECEANARLIAAAPDLLAACEDVDRFYQENIEVMPVAFQTFADIIAAAIAKAKGGDA